MNIKQKHLIYVYGTLRPGGAVTHLVPGKLYNLGWFPGIKLGAPDDHEWVVCERLEVDDEKLAELDRYEGYHPNDPKSSLYLRVPYMDGEIYVFNGSFENYDRIESGNWLEYIDKDKGGASGTVKDCVETVKNYDRETEEEAAGAIEEVA